MAPSRMILISPLIALIAAGSAEVHAQQPVPARSSPAVARVDRGAQAAPAAKAQPAPAAKAQPAPTAKAQPANDPARMKWLLKAWEGQSAKLKTLDVKIYRVDRAFRWREEVHFEGRAVFQSPDLAYIDFWKLKTEPNAKKQLVPVKDPKDPKHWIRTHIETIVCNNNAVWQYLWEGRQIFIFPLAKGERQRALDEGPLPFLFNMKAEEAEARYQMDLQAEDARYYTVRVLPKLEEDQQSFKLALLSLEKKFLLPARIVLLSPDGTSSREYYLPIEDQKPNYAVDPKIFKGGVYKGWTVQKNPAPEAPRQGNAGPRPGGAGASIRR